MLELLFLLTQILAYETASLENLRIGQSYQGLIFSKITNHSLYYFQVPDLKNTSDLVIMVKTFNPLADPNVYISRINDAPLTTKDGDVLICQAKGTDTCVLSKDKVQNNETLYLAVVSRVPCEFQIRIDLDQELKLYRDDFLLFKMNISQQSQIINLDVGPLHGQENEIEIIFSVRNLDELEEPYQAYMNKAENGIPNNEKYDYIAKDLLQNKIIEINKKQLNLFSKYIILISAQQGAMFYVEAIVNNQTKKIDFWEQKQQVVEKGDYDFYALDLSKYQSEIQQKNIQITLTSFEGYASLYVNPNMQPPLLQSYLWSEGNKLGDSIIITNEELKDIELNSLYIAIYGEQFCTYSLQVIYDYQDDNYKDYLPQQVLNYRKVIKGHPLILMIHLFNIKNSTIQVNLNKIVGNSNFIITNYVIQDQTTQKEIDNFIQYQKDYEASSDYIFFYSNTQKVDNFRIFCKELTDCFWFIIVYLDDSEIKEEGKVCISYHIIEDLYILQENTPHKSSIEKDNLNYYKFIVQDSDQIDNLQFIVTPITGQVKIYISQTKLHPNSSNCDEYSTNNVIKIPERTGEKLKSGAYFISLSGIISSKYIITVLVNREDNDQQIGQSPWHYIQLTQGDPQYNQLGDNEVALYKIDLLQFENISKSKSTVTIFLYNNYGEFTIYGFDKPEADISKHKWKATQILQILESDNNYPEILFLQIKSSTENYGGFFISCSFENQLIWLYAGSYHLSYMQFNQNYQYIYEFKINDTFILAQKALINDQSKVIMKIYDEENYEITYSKSKRFAQIRLQNEKAQQCSENHIKCLFQLQFELTATNNLFFAILIIDSLQNELQLYDSQPLTKNLPLIKDNFYFYTNRKEISIICFSSIRTKMTILVKFVQNMDESYPSSEREDYHKQSQQFSFHYQSSLYLSEKELMAKQCHKTCLIKITVIPEYTEEEGENENLLIADYTIQLDQGSILLIEGSTMEGKIQEIGIQYYKARLLEDDQNLMILLTPLQQCNFGLYVSKYEFPTPQNFDWKSDDDLSNSLIIEAGNQVHPEMKGNYLIGVVGPEDCQFAIQYSLGQMQMYNIFINNPQKIQIKEGEIVYLKLDTHQHYFQSPLQFFITSFSNTATMFIEEQDWQNFNQDYLTKELEQFKYNNTGQGYNNYIEIMGKAQQKDFIIAVQAKYLEDVTIQVNYNQLITYMQTNVLYKSHIQPDSQIFFNLSNSDEKIITLWISVESGEIKEIYILNAGTFLENSSKNLELHNDISYRYQIETPDSFVVLRIISLQETFFTIQFQNGDGSYKTLQYYLDQFSSIHPDYFYLKSREHFGYTYHNNQYNESIRNSDQQIFSVTVGIITGYNFKIDGKYKNTLPKVTVYAKNKDYKVMHSVLQELDDLLYMEFIECDTIYNIIISSNSQQDQNGFIVINSYNVRQLFPKLKYIQTEKLQESTYWKLQKIQQLTLFYDFQFCGGLFQVFLSSDLEKLRNGQYESQIQTENNQNVQGYLDLRKFLENDLYFKITPYKTLSKVKQPSYTLKILVFDEIYIPYQDIHPGEYGVLDHSIQQNSDTLNLQVSFASLNYNNQLAQVVDKVEYFLLVQERDEMDDERFNFCVFPNQGQRTVYDQFNRSQQITLSTQINNETKLGQNNFVITILAKAHINLKDEQQISLDYYYESKHVRFNIEIDSQSISQLIYLIITFIIFLIVTLIFLLQYLRGRLKDQDEATENQTQFNQEIELKYRGMAN